MSDKPFPCERGGCTMTFANEDHLIVHRKKHDMVLNLGLIPKNNTVAGNISISSQYDQTPTPTRFIRNCEEVGLFQDLQNVNPFEETFKKALELKVGEPAVQRENSDDTLHTPHILPHINIHSPVKENTSDLDESVFVFSNEILKIKSSSEEDDPPPAKSAVIQKLKKNLTSKEKVNEPLNNVSNKRRGSDVNGSPAKKINIYDKNVPEADRRREMNRMAQLRSRQKKKQLKEEYDQTMSSLKEENNRLHVENQQLRSELGALKKLMLKHKKCVFEGEESVIPEVDNRLLPVKEKTVPTLIPKIQGIDSFGPIIVQMLPVPVQNDEKQLGSSEVDKQFIVENQIPLIDSEKVESNSMEEKKVGHKYKVNLLRKGNKR